MSEAVGTRTYGDVSGKFINLMKMKKRNPELELDGIVAKSKKPRVKFAEFYH